MLVVSANEEVEQRTVQPGQLDGSIAIYLTPAANALAVAKLVKEKMEALSRDFPPGLSYSIPFNTTTFVETSINEVYVTLAEAGRCTSPQAVRPQLLASW